MSVATQKSWQHVNTTIVIRFKGRVCPVFFRYGEMHQKSWTAPNEINSSPITI